MVPPFTRLALSPRCLAKREAISPAALLVNVKAQIREGSALRCAIRNRMRSARQNVLPAPGPARTRIGPDAASIASRCEGDGAAGGSTVESPMRGEVATGAIYSPYISVIRRRRAPASLSERTPTFFPNRDLPMVLI